MDIAARTGALPPPNALINASDRTMRAQGFKAGYVYDHDCEQRSPGRSSCRKAWADTATPTSTRRRAWQRANIGKRMRLWNSLREKLRAAR